MIELTACPPSEGRPSISITRFPARAASIAADAPEAPDPTTQMSHSRSITGDVQVRETMRVSGSKGRLSISGPSRLDTLVESYANCMSIESYVNLQIYHA